MPLVGTLGAASSKGFGFTRRPTTTTTFVSSQSWTAPAGVTSLITLTGKGSDGTAQQDYYTPVTSYAEQFTGTLANAPYASWATIYSASNSKYSTLLARVGLSGPSSGIDSQRWRVNSSNNWALVTTANNLSAYTIGSVTNNTLGSPKTSGNVVYSTDFGSGATIGWYVAVDYYTPATNGTNTTGFSQTFAGGTGGPATPVTYTNVAVTPGSSYTLTIPSGGYITITYYT